jgi:hypothetical protein
MMYKVMRVDKTGSVIPASRVYHYPIIKRLLDFIFKILLVLICQLEIQTYYVAVGIDMNALPVEYYEIILIYYITFIGNNLIVILLKK